MYPLAMYPLATRPRPAAPASWAAWCAGGSWAGSWAGRWRGDLVRVRVRARVRVRVRARFRVRVRVCGQVAWRPVEVRGDRPAVLVLLAVTRVGDRLAADVDGPRCEIDDEVGVDARRAVRLGHGHAAAVAAPRVAQHQRPVQPLHA